MHEKTLLLRKNSHPHCTSTEVFKYSFLMMCFMRQEVTSGGTKVEVAEIITPQPTVKVAKWLRSDYLLEGEVNICEEKKREGEWKRIQIFLAKLIRSEKLPKFYIVEYEALDEWVGAIYSSLTGLPAEGIQNVWLALQRMLLWPVEVNVNGCWEFRFVVHPEYVKCCFLDARYNSLMKKIIVGIKNTGLESRLGSLIPLLHSEKNISERTEMKVEKEFSKRGLELSRTSTSLPVRNRAKKLKGAPDFYNEMDFNDWYEVKSLRQGLSSEQFCVMKQLMKAGANVNLVVVESDGFIMFKACEEGDFSDSE